MSDHGTLLADPAALFADLEGARGLVIAVSGGPDSTALMALVAAWPERPPALVVTVDHGLRREAADETALVAANAEKLGLPVQIVAAGPVDGRGNLQATARAARYSLLVEAARAAGHDTIVTAHHRNDQAETFLLRLARGSGVYGLAAMAPITRLDGLTLARPLLDVSRQALLAVAQASGLAVVDDPTNADMRYDRVRMRQLLPLLADHGLTVEQLSETASRLGRAAEAIDGEATRILELAVTTDEFGVAHCDPTLFRAIHREVGLRAIARLLQAVSGSPYTPALKPLERLYATIADRRSGPVRRTLHGTTVAISPDRFTVSREWGRRGPENLAVKPGEAIVFDGRFAVSVPENGILARPNRRQKPLCVGPLGKAPVRARASGIRRTALATLPGLYRGETLIGLPRQVVFKDERSPLVFLPVRGLVAGRLAAARSLPAFVPPE
ncbi:MAG TPA: tRNA lysidine(34) synthetase TilS [Afifellaceae bacterium]|nr:tRNA lysidine(34) synthetase TilS [Afifellaceae bacterium]